tara:strand:+ start:539 stop:865 length:327 start_codon:yes stop_codon:yes gene_type:complete
MNKLEEAMGRLNHIEQDIEAMMYAIGDSTRKYTEDELLNMLIGMNQLHKTRYEMMWQEYENFKKGAIHNFNDFNEEEFHRNLEEDLDKKHQEAMEEKRRREEALSQCI